MSKREPKIRFKGFTDEWEETKLNNTIIHEQKGTAKGDMCGNESPYLETGYLNGGPMKRVGATNNVDREDVIILWDGSQAGTVYHGFTGALGSTLKAYKTRENGHFIYQYLKRNQKAIYMKYRTPNIPHVIKDFTTQFSISIPTTPEQNKIGLLFKVMDNLITARQKQLDLLKEQKKGFLQKMFPKAGETVPEIRFAGFVDDWEQCKVGDLSKTTFGGGTPKTSVLEY